MATKIVTKNSSTAGSAPLASDLVQGELAVNVTDKRLYTENASGTIVEVGTNPSAEIIANGGIALPDNGKATFGASDDLEIYHDGSNSIIKDGGTGDLQIRAANFKLNNAEYTTTMLEAYVGGAVSLWYDNAAKLATTSTGIDVTGTATMDGLTVDGVGSFSSSAPYIDLFETDTTDLNSRIVSNSSSLRLQTVADNGSNASNRLLIDHSTGDISFYEDTGTTPKLFWDASAESLGIGTSSPSTGLDVATTNYTFSGTTYDIYGLFGDTSGGIRLGADSSNDDSVIGTTGTNDLQFVTYNGSSWDSRMTLSNTGFVGIGTNSPAAQLELSSATGATLRLSRDDTTIVGPNSIGLIEFYTADTDSAGVGASIAGVADGSGGNVALAFSSGTGGSASEAMRIDSSGNVGIGTSSPNTKLHVLGGRSTFYSGDNYAVGVGNASGELGGYMGSPAVNVLSFSEPGGIERMRIASGGNVGIGTTSPSEKLHIQGDGADILLTDAAGGQTAKLGATGSNNGLLELNNSAHVGTVFLNSSGDSYLNGGNVGIGVSPTNVNGYTTLNVGAGSIGSIIKIDGANAGHYHRILNNNGQLFIQADQGNTTGSSAIVFGVDATERMRIDSSGNVGIGTASPSGKVHIQTPAGTAPKYYIGQDATSAWSVGTPASTNALHFRDEQFSAIRMAIDNSGNVGIGAIPSTHRLEVKGDNNIAKFYSAATDTELKIAAPTVNVIGLYTGTADALTFGTADTERMRIDSSGNLLVSKTSTSATIRGSYIDAQGRMFNAQPNGAAPITFQTTSNGTTIGSISVTASATSYNTSSDQRLKENIADADDAGSKIDAIQVRQYEWKADGSHQDYGMIAQELVEVAPEAVSVPENSEEMMGVDYSKLVPMLIKEIQSLRNRVAQLEG